MAKKLIRLLPILVMVCLVFAACNNNTVKTYKVTFKVDNAIYKTVETDNTSIVMPEAPEKPDKNFDGWFYDKDVWSQPFKAEDLATKPLTEDVTVYAKFVDKEPEGPSDGPGTKIALDMPFEGSIYMGRGEDLSFLSTTKTKMVDEKYTGVFYPAGYNTPVTVAYYLEGENTIVFEERVTFDDFQKLGEATVDGNIVTGVLNYDNKIYEFSNQLYKVSVTYGEAGKKDKYEDYWMASGYEVILPIEYLFTESDRITFDGKQYTYEQFKDLQMPKKNVKLDVTPNRVVNSGFNAKLILEENLRIELTMSAIQDSGYYYAILTQDETDTTFVYTMAFGRIYCYTITEDSQFVPLAEGIINRNVFDLKLLKRDDLKIEAKSYSFELYKLSVSMGTTQTNVWTAGDVLITELIPDVELMEGSEFNFNGSMRPASELPSLKMPLKDSIIQVDPKIIVENISKQPFDGIVSSRGITGTSYLQFTKNSSVNGGYTITMSFAGNGSLEGSYMISKGTLQIGIVVQDDQGNSQGVIIGEGTTTKDHINITITYDGAQYTFDCDVHKLSVNYGEDNKEEFIGNTWIEKGMELRTALGSYLNRDDTIKFNNTTYTLAEFDCVMPEVDSEIFINPDCFVKKGFDGTVYNVKDGYEYALNFYSDEEGTTQTGDSVYPLAIYDGERNASMMLHYSIRYGKIYIFSIMQGGYIVYLGSGSINHDGLEIYLDLDGKTYEFSSKMHRLEFKLESDVQGGNINANLWISEDMTFGALLSTMIPEGLQIQLITTGDQTYKTQEELEALFKQSVPKEDISIYVQCIGVNMDDYN